MFTIVSDICGHVENCKFYNWTQVQANHLETFSMFEKIIRFSEFAASGSRYENLILFTLSSQNVKS